MGAGEFRANRFVTQFNIASVILEGEAITPLDLVLQDVTYRFAYVSGDISAGYFLVKNPKLEIAGLLGIKYIYFDIGGQLIYQEKYHSMVHAVYSGLTQS